MMLDRLRILGSKRLVSASAVIPADILKSLLIIFTVWVGVVVSISYFATNELHVITTNESKAVTQANNLPVVAVPDALAGLPKWDSGWYLEIALHGYTSDPSVAKAKEQEAQKPAFFPLYPALIKPFAMVGANPVVTGFIINVLLSFGALIFLFLLAQKILRNNRAALHACILFLVFPTSFYMLSIYTEALFCFLSFGAFYFAMQRRWLLSNVMLALCTASRSAGVIVALAVFLEYLHSKNFSWRTLDRQILYFLLAPLGLVAFALYLAITFGDPLAMVHAQANWGQSIQPNLLATIYHQTAGVILNFVHSGYNAYGTDWTREWTNFMVWALWMLAVAVTVKAWFVRAIPRIWIFYMVASLLFFVSKGNFISVNRYVLVLFPVYILLARYTERSETTYTATILASTAFLIMGLVDFSISYWTG
jgi:Gpi18-like mannosyltransferase